MYLVIGHYSSYGDGENHIFGYSSCWDRCTEFVEKLKAKHLEFKKHQEMSRTIVANLNKFPPQEKGEKFKDYQKRLQPINDNNERLLQEANEKRRILDTSIEDFDKYNDIDFVHFTDFEIKEIEEIQPIA